MNHCPVYTRIGGQAYGTVYPGPIGKIISPHLMGLENDPGPSVRLVAVRRLRRGLPGEDPDSRRCCAACAKKTSKSPTRPTR